MKLLGLRGNQLLSLQQNSRACCSSRYEERGLQIGTFEERIRALRRQITTEITIVSPYLLSLEDLANRYYDDSQLAWLDGEVAYFNAYTDGYERTKVISDNIYRLMPEVI